MQNSLPTSATDSAAPRRLAASDRRRQLLELALDTFSQKGYQGTTTKEIAAAAGVTEAIIFRHFPNKQALYSAVLDAKHESGEIADTLAQWQTFMDSNNDLGLFRALIHKVFHSYRSDPRLNRVLLFAALEGHESGLQQHRQRSFPLYERLCQYVTRRQIEGAIRPGNPGAIIATLVGAAAYYAQMTSLFGFAAEAPDPQMAEDFLQIVMKGIQAT